MGDRGNIIIKTAGESDLYLYTHWRGSALPHILKAALGRRQRWDDAAYLTRIIFCEMVKGSEQDETGFGISTYMCDGGTDLSVDMDAQTVDGVPFAKFIEAKAA